MKDHRLILPKPLRDVMLSRLQEEHPGSSAMHARAEHIWWPYMLRENIEYARNCRACAEAG